MLKKFTYKFNEGPFITEKDLLGNWKEGNCRRALQYYFFKKHGIFLPPEKVLCPWAYKKTGKFIFREKINFDWEKLRPGDIIYAERKSSLKKGVSVEKSETSFDNRDEYLVSLHTAIFIGKSGKEIWHATSIEGKSCYWPISELVNYYLPVTVKRIIAR